jgi:hypothetical protein
VIITPPRYNHTRGNACDNYATPARYEPQATVKFSIKHDACTIPPLKTYLKVNEPNFEKLTQIRFSSYYLRLR